MNLQEMMRQAQRMQKKMQKVQEETAQQTVEGSAGGGMVVVVVNGASEVKSVKIERAVVIPDELEMLQDLVVAATNQALSRASDMMKEAVAKVAGGMPIPGLL